jgi:hypothetical protein
MIFKAIFTSQTSLPESHPDWVASYTQYPNETPIFTGYQCNWDAVYQGSAWYDKNPKFILQESKTETLYVDGGFRECKTWVYATKNDIYSPDEFEMRIVKQRVKISGGITKLIYGQSPYYLEDFDYVVYGLKK